MSSLSKDVSVYTEASDFALELQSLGMAYVRSTLASSSVQLEHFIALHPSAYTHIAYAVICLSEHAKILVPCFM